MAGSINKVMLLGNVGNEPVVKDTVAGKRLLSFRFATTETWKDQSGQRQERTEWHNIVIFNEGLAGVIEQYVHKGSRLFLQGKIQYRKRQEENGNQRVITDIVVDELTLLDSKK